jgi:hypothetical protein
VVAVRPAQPVQPAPTAFARELRAAIDRSGRPLAAICAELATVQTPISPASLSAWQRGRYAPTPDQRLHALERVLGLRAGTLTIHLPRPPAPPAAAVTVDRLDRDLAASAQPSLPGDYLLIAVHDDVQVDEQGRLTISVRQTVRAARPGVDAAWHLHPPGTAGARTPRPAGLGVAGCRPGRQVRLPSGQLATELLFDRQLVPGETHTFRTHEPAVPASASYHREVRGHTVERLLIRVSFARPPAAAWISHQPPGGAAAQHPATVRDAAVTLAVTSPAPAAYGIRWRS